ncbi:MAG: hypothetical protein IPN68_01165 [Bacteroidetes bacterium]|nr:hypothetical protein [Bacteroidota bacterium]
MKIDRSNYEIWFIDWLDGKLNEIQTEQLELFLSENPDLREELRELSDIRIAPPATRFHGKIGIKKSLSDLSDNQFEYLCAAAIENELSEGQLAELSDITTSDPKRKRVLELYGKTILTPPDIKYGHKRKLLRSTPLQKVIRLTVAGLSAAASIAILIIASFYLTGKEKFNEYNLSQMMNEGRAMHSGISSPSIFTAVAIRQNGKQIIQNQQISVINLTLKDERPDTIELKEEIHISQNHDLISLAVIPEFSGIAAMNNSSFHNNLEQINFSIPVESDNRWEIGKIIAKSFRERILKEDTSDESPIKGYEIAEAGVTGINKLFGWQMAFEKNSDPNGDVRSVYFSSKILKIQTPVNKPESAE